MISFTGPVPVLLRPGGISESELVSVIGPLASGSDSPEENLESPGLLKSHYAPRTPLKVFSRIPDELFDSADVGLLLNRTPERGIAGPYEILSSAQDTQEIALNLYAAIRRLDRLGLRLIAAEWALKTAWALRSTTAWKKPPRAAGCRSDRLRNRTVPGRHRIVRRGNPPWGQ